MPITSDINGSGHLTIGGCDVVDLAEEHGTPLYVFDEATVRGACREWIQALTAAYPNSRLLYAAKAFFNLSLAEVFRQEGLGLDVASEGELEAGVAAGFEPAAITQHGNNKSRAELELAVRLDVGAIVIDSADELALITEVLRASPGRRLRALVRVNPNIDPHTHAYISTGTIDSKFGVPIRGGHAEKLIMDAASVPGLEVLGLHFHLGSQILDIEPYRLGVAQVIEYAAHLNQRHGFDLREFSPGGGFGVPYLGGRAPQPADYVGAIVEGLRVALGRHELPEPVLILEAGRALVARAGVALYRVGSVKRIPGVRNYVAVDGGMGDNIRPALYGARYAVLTASRVEARPDEWVRVVGKYCESGDILVGRARLPRPRPGDLLAMPMSGAYAPALASNYNLSTRPAMVLARDGEARLIRRRERLDDLMRGDTEIH